MHYKFQGYKANIKDVVKNLENDIQHLFCRFLKGVTGCVKQLNEECSDEE